MKSEYIDETELSDEGIKNKIHRYNSIGNKKASDMGSAKYRQDFNHGFELLNGPNPAS